MPGYISLHRDIQKHWLYEEERVYSRYEAWLDILMRVNHAEGKVTHNGTVEVVSRGSTIWSMGDMEKHWGWSNKKVKRFLLCLEDDQMLSVKSTTKKTYITVINYDKYQGSDIDEAPPMHQQSTTEAFQKHNKSIQTIITNNLNNLKDSTPITTSTRVYHENPFSLFETHKFGKLDAMSRDIIGDTIDTYTEDWVIRAIKESVKANVTVWNYVEKILKRWKSTDHAEPWTLEKEEPPQKQNNVRQFNNRQTSGKPQLPIIADSPKSTPMSDEKREELRRKARILDGKPEEAG